MIVIDASAIIDAALGDRHVGALLIGAELHAPVSVDAEVLHGLRRVLLGRRITLDEAEYAIDFVANMSITRHWVKPFIRRMWSLRHNITAYDAGYVALAESLGFPLLTRDRRLAKSSGHAARIEYID